MNGIKRWASTALNPKRNGFALDVFVLTSLVLCVVYGFIL